MPPVTIDSHCHLTHPRLAPESDGIVARAREAGLLGCISIGTGVDDAARCAELAARHAGFVHCTGGLDPFTSFELGDRFDEQLEELGRLLAGGEFCALGEVGLDYHYDLDPGEVQISRLERQLDLALRLELPVVIHVREAHDDMVAVLERFPAVRGVIHSFTAGPSEAERYLDAGWHLGLNGVLTFPSATDLRRAVEIVPDDRLLVETDSPYLAPVPLRGRHCEPAFVTHTLRRLAALRSADVDELARSTAANAVRLFGLE